MEIAQPWQMVIHTFATDSRLESENKYSPWPWSYEYLQPPRITNRITFARDETIKQTKVDDDIVGIRTRNKVREIRYK